MEIQPILILLVGIAVVLAFIIWLRMNAFLALIAAAFIVSLLAPGAAADKIARVALAFGETAGKIGIVIAMASIIGRCLTDSGAADRIVRMFVAALGQKRCPVSLMASGFVLSIPVFFDTVFYLLLPLARSMHRRTGIRYMLLILAMGTGASITHSLVPPTPGPLILAEMLKIDIGLMMMVGLLTGACTAVVMLFFIRWFSARVDFPMRPIEGWSEEPQPLPDAELPNLFASALPILLPVVLISANTIVSMLASGTAAHNVTAVTGNPNLAMALAAAVSLFVLWQKRRPTRRQMTDLVENSLLSAGVIILITSAGGAFGAMLKEARVGPALQNLMMSDTAQNPSGVALLCVAFLIAFLLKFAQGSTTVAMITTAAMLAPLLGSAQSIGCHPVYIACAVGFGAQCGGWMNDSGFWIIAKMSGLTELETLKAWTTTVSVLSLTGLAFTLLFATLLPLT